MARARPRTAIGMNLLAKTMDKPGMAAAPAAWNKRDSSNHKNELAKNPEREPNPNTMIPMMIKRLIGR